MKKKISTILDDALVRRTKIEALRQDKQISEVIGEALETYLAEKGSPRGPGGVVANSWGVLALPRERVDEILSEELYPENL